MVTERGRKELEGALVCAVEEDAAGAGEVGREVVGALVRVRGTGRGVERSVALGEGVGGRGERKGGEGPGVRGEQGADGGAFFVGEDGAIVATGGAAGGEVAGAEGDGEGVVIEDRLAELPP
jgi:hypothetical protein